MSLHSPHQSHIGQFFFNPATPPLPPPKPSAQSSGTATPLGPPRPPPPPGQTVPRNPDQYTGAHAIGQAHGYQEVPSIAPPPEGWLPEIVKGKMTPDLHALLSDPTLQQALLHHPDTTHPSIPASTAPLQALLNDNLTLANSLKSLESQILAQREAVQSRLLSLRALERQFRAKQAEQDTALRDFSPPALYQRLTASITEQESLCRGLEESFLEGDGEQSVASDREVEMFVKRLKEARKVAYLRRERKERWDEGRVGGWR